MALAAFAGGLLVVLVWWSLSTKGFSWSDFARHFMRHPFLNLGILLGPVVGPIIGMIRRRRERRYLEVLSHQLEPSRDQAGNIAVAENQK